MDDLLPLQTKVTVDERRSHLEPAANHCGGEEKNKVAKIDDFNYLILYVFFRPAAPTTKNSEICKVKNSVR
jgi:hypothetical protein